MRLVEVSDSSHVREFLALPTRIYREHPQWISPLDHEIEAIFDSKRNINLAQGAAIRWILTDAKGETIGRVAAFVNPATAHADATLPTGGMGFFECINDQAAANILFEACRAWLIEQGMEAMDGPINFGERDRFWGLLVAGFSEPNYGMFYHPSYYQQLFENFGFQLYFKQYTYYREIAPPLHPNFEHVADRYAQQHPEFRFAHASKQDLEGLAHDFHHVYNLAWANHNGVAAMTIDKARNLVQQMKPVLDERLLWFAYHHNEPVAFFVSLPELNQIFRYVDRRFSWWAKLRFLWEMRRYNRRPDKKMFGVIFGVVPAWQGKGVESALMIHAQREFLRIGYSEIEMNWIGDFNPRMLALMRSSGARVQKTHVTYRYLFDRERTFERSPIIR